MISSAVTVGTTAVKIMSKVPSFRNVYLHVEGNGTVYLGAETVTSTTGLPTQKHTTPIEIKVPANEELWAITASGTETLHILRPSNDGS